MRVRSLADFPLKDGSLFEQAMTHSSAGGPQAGKNYERLEFLGDAVLQLLVTEHLCGAHPGATEGELTKKRAALVRGETLADVALTLGVEQFVRWGAREQQAAEEHKRRIFGCVLEAFIGAMYLDQGYEACRSFVHEVYEPWFKGDRPALLDPKSELQEKVQKDFAFTPTYEVVEKSGEAHEPQFTVKVQLGNGDTFLGSGKSRKKAEEAAASEALKFLQMNEEMQSATNGSNPVNATANAFASES